MGFQMLQNNLFCLNVVWGFLVITILVTVIDAGCPRYDRMYKGFLSLNLNKLAAWKSDSWQECRNRCRRNKYTLIPCYNWAWDGNNGVCILQNGDTYGSSSMSNYVSGNVYTIDYNDCSTTCKVSSWSAWSTTCHRNVFGGITVRSRKITTKPRFPFESCPEIVDLKTCGHKQSLSEIKQTSNPSNYFDPDGINSSFHTDNYKNCPSYDIAQWGWGCTLEGEDVEKTHSDTWYNCLDKCKQNPSCANWSFRSIMHNNEPSDIIRTECFLFFGQIGCKFHSLGWISGSRTTNSLECNPNCVLGDWSTWSSCGTEICKGTGSAKVSYQYRGRAILTLPHGTGKKCPGITYDERECPLACSIPSCSVGDWSEWSKCTNSCGGVKTRGRALQIIPKIGGLMCPGLLQASAENCNSCNGYLNCNIGEWTQWSECNKSCGGGDRVRYRTNRNPPCPPSAQRETCNLDVCANEFYNDQPWITVSMKPVQIQEQFGREQATMYYSKSGLHQQNLFMGPLSNNTAHMWK